MKLKVGDVVQVLMASKYWGYRDEVTENFAYSIGLITEEDDGCDCVQVEISSHRWGCSVEEVSEFGFAPSELQKIGVL